VDLGNALDAEAEDAAEDDAGDATGEADENGLAQELGEDVTLARSDRAPNASTTISSIA
jgi:hypothetical protein